MEQDLLKLRRWMSHGSARQFYTEIAYKIVDQGYEAEIIGNTVTCYLVKKQGGFLGIGARKVKTPVLVVTQRDHEVDIDARNADPEFVAGLTELLRAH
ncbi:MAG: hypothetical protein GXY68_10880 [Chloroflexi bacterium]|jgi:hypothetical protein|nr:hypothetical protein [Chloroflexota bacterium]